MLEWSSRFTPLVKIQKAREELLIAAQSQSWLDRAERLQRADAWIAAAERDLRKLPA